MNNYFVYKHRRLDTNEIFYIGISKNKKRAYIKCNRNKYWKNIVSNTKYSVEIVKSNLTKNEALTLEMSLIHTYGRLDLKTGNLVNRTSGGQGSYKPLIPNGSKKVINIYTKEIFNSITEAAKSQNRSFSFLSTHLNSKNNKSDFVFLENFNDNIKELKHIKFRKEQIINKESSEIFNNVKEAAKSLNIDDSGLSKKLRGIYKNNTPFEYLRIYKYSFYANN